VNFCELTHPSTQASVSSRAATRYSPSSGPENARRSCPRARPRSRRSSPGASGQAQGPRRDRFAARQGSQPLQDGEALRHRDHRRRLVVVRDEDSITAEAASTDLRAENDDRRRRTGRGRVISAYKDLAESSGLPLHEGDRRRVASGAPPPGGPCALSRFICMLSLSQLPPPPQPRPLTFTDTEPPTRDDRSPRFGLQGSKKEGAAKKNAEGGCARFRELLEHLGLLPQPHACCSSPRSSSISSRRRRRLSDGLRAPRRAGPSTSCSQNYLVRGVNSQVGGREHASGK